MKLQLRKVATVSILSVTLAGCGNMGCGPKAKVFRIALSAVSDDGEPVRGATFTAESATLGTTNQQGKSAIFFRGVEGQVLAVRTTCPQGFVSPEVPTALRLTEVRRVNQGEPSALNVESPRSEKRGQSMHLRQQETPLGSAEAYELNAANLTPTGCDSHPNLLTHVAMAEELAAKIKPILGW